MSTTVMVILNRVTVIYDNAIGNAEYLLTENMTQDQIDEMKGVLQQQAKGSKSGLDGQVNNKNDINKIIDAENQYLAVTDEMIKTLDAVTIDKYKGCAKGRKFKNIKNYMGNRWKAC
ncbi:hypothetical protein [Fictibacillus sp. KU28468]|uniref:hypothetical protein n=1 Tax=Fictibacillus sp. KU28468 TaxID=2991053 RepID=UPI00223E52E7|nr:hypothetical protein [Fictibacillus sp. KU28468]UZJ79693.1 hypothetical protein OKX00_04225 [Fictibacillus sp. KU28468]